MSNVFRFSEFPSGAPGPTRSACLSSGWSKRGRFKPRRWVAWHGICDKLKIVCFFNLAFSFSTPRRYFYLEVCFFVAAKEPGSRPRRWVWWPQKKPHSVNISAERGRKRKPRIALKCEQTYLPVEGRGVSQKGVPWNHPECTNTIVG